MDSLDPSELTAAVTPLPVATEPAAAKPGSGTSFAAESVAFAAEAVAQAYDRRPSMQSLVISRALRLSLRHFIHRVPGNVTGIRTARTAVEAASRLISHHPGARVEPLIDPQVESGSTGRPILGEWVAPAEPEGAADGAILYLHGGAYIVCSPRTHRPITSRLAVDTGLPVLVPHYRLAPEHPFPAALEDALDAYRWLLDRGFSASRIVIAGDSAGGHLAASLTGEICRAGLPVPAGVVLFSPWVDLTCELSTQQAAQVRDPYVSAYAAQRIGRLVVGATAFDDPRLALLACPWTGTPPFFIQVGGAEVLRTEAERLAEALAEAGAYCELQVWKGQMHVFQILNRLLPEARAAMRDTARFIKSVMADPAAAETSEAVA